MSQITTADVYIDVQLTDVSVRFSNDAYLADVLFPIVTVKKRSGIMYKYDKSNLKAASSLRTGVDRANRVEYGLTKVAYGPLLEHALEEAIEWDIKNEAIDPLDPSIDAVNNISERMLVEKEVLLATLMTNTAIITQTATPSVLWDVPATSTPFKDIEKGRLAIQKSALKKPNCIWMGLDVWANLKNHPDFISRVAYTRLPTLTTDLMKDLFPGIENIYIGEAMQNTGADNQADVLTPIWGKHLFIGYVTPQPGIRTVSLGYTLTLENARYVDAWTEQQVKADFVRVNDYFQQYVVAQEAGYSLLNVQS